MRDLMSGCQRKAKSARNRASHGIQGFVPCAAPPAAPGGSGVGGCDAGGDCKGKFQEILFYWKLWPVMDTLCFPSSL